METKKWYQSKTIWGILISAIGFFASSVLSVPELVLPENADFEQLKAYADAVKAANGKVEVLISQAAGFLGAIYAIYGRIKSETKVTI